MRQKSIEPYDLKAMTSPIIVKEFGNRITSMAITDGLIHAIDEEGTYTQFLQYDTQVCKEWNIGLGLRIVRSIDQGLIVISDDGIVSRCELRDGELSLIHMFSTVDRSHEGLVLWRYLCRCLYQIIVTDDKLTLVRMDSDNDVTIIPYSNQYKFIDVVTHRNSIVSLYCRDTRLYMLDEGEMIEVGDVNGYPDKIRFMVVLDTIIAIMNRGTWNTGEYTCDIVYDEYSCMTDVNSGRSELIEVGINSNDS